MPKRTNIPDPDCLPNDPMLYALQGSMREMQNFLGFTQEQLADKLSFSRATIIRLENGSTKFQLKTAMPYVCFLECCRLRRPWNTSHMRMILQQHVRNPEDRTLFLADSFIESWERHFPTDLPEKTRLPELYASHWLGDFYLDPLTVPSAAFPMLKETASIMIRNNLQFGYRAQCFTVLQSSLNQLVQAAENDPEAAAVKTALEQLQHDNLLVLLPSGSGDQNSDFLLASEI